MGTFMNYAGKLTKRPLSLRLRDHLSRRFRRRRNRLEPACCDSDLPADIESGIIGFVSTRSASGVCGGFPLIQKAL
jgi:hypothetical protein